MKQGEFLKELRGLSGDDLRGRAKQIAEEMMKLRFRSAVGQLEQQHRIKGLRRDLARVLTVSREMAGSVTDGSVTDGAVTGSAAKGGES